MKMTHYLEFPSLLADAASRLFAPYSLHFLMPVKGKGPGVFTGG
jgi:hypothetical protein